MLQNYKVCSSQVGIIVQLCILGLQVLCKLQQGQRTDGQRKHRRLRIKSLFDPNHVQRFLL